MRFFPHKDHVKNQGEQVTGYREDVVSHAEAFRWVQVAIVVGVFLGLCLGMIAFGR